MRHLVSGRKLQRTSSHRRALLKNMATSLFEHKRLETTTAKAKELRPYAEKLISKAKFALRKEKAGLVADGNSIDVHTRRVVGRYLKSKAVVQELFDTIAPMVESRPGGYCRIIKVGYRRGDAAETSIIELVDWSNPVDGIASSKTKKKVTRAKKENKIAPVKKSTPKAEATPVADAPKVEEPVAIVEDKKAENVKVFDDTIEPIDQNESQEEKA